MRLTSRLFLPRVNAPISNSNLLFQNKMLHIFFYLLVWLGALGATQALTLDKLPGPPGMPMTQGSMLHINVVFTNSPTNTFNVTLDPGTPFLAPLTYWSPGDVLDSVDPWYLTLDPTQGAGQFSGRYGFLLDTSASDTKPPGTSFGIKFISSTPGLSIYFYRFTAPKQFVQVFTPSHDYVLWSGAMWHPIFVMPASTPYGTPVSATFEMFLANATNSGNVDWTTTASAVPGYETQQFTINWVAIPEPHATALAAMALALLATRHRRRGL